MKNLKDLSQTELANVVTGAYEEIERLQHLQELQNQIIKKVEEEIERRKKALDTIVHQSKMHVKKISKKETCGFDKAWVGTCASKNLLSNGQCEEHQAICSCGKLATRECSHAGQFVCGRLLCDDCRCKGHF